MKSAPKSFSLRPIAALLFATAILPLLNLQARGESVTIKSIQFELVGLDVAIAQLVGGGSFVKFADGIVPIRRISETVFVVGWTPADMQVEPLASLLPGDGFEAERKMAACVLVANYIPTIIAHFAAAKGVVTTTPVYCGLGSGVGQFSLASGYVLQLSRP